MDPAASEELGKVDPQTSFDLIHPETSILLYRSPPQTLLQR